MSDKTAAADASSHTDAAAKPLPFKQPGFLHSGIGGAAAGKKNRTWKNLKQILALERALPWQLNDPSYFNIDAPPSCKPAKKYSDISGLPNKIILRANLQNYKMSEKHLMMSAVFEHFTVNQDNKHFVCPCISDPDENKCCDAKISAYSDSGKNAPSRASNLK